MRAEPLDKFHLLHFNSKLHLKTNIWRNAQEDLCIINCKIKGWLLFTSSAVHFSLYWFPSLKKSQGMKLIPYISAGKSMHIGFCQWMASYCFGDSVKADALEGSLKVRTGANVTYGTVRWWQVKTMPHRHLKALLCSLTGSQVRAPMCCWGSGIYSCEESLCVFWWRKLHVKLSLLVFICICYKYCMILL